MQLFVVRAQSVWDKLHTRLGAAAVGSGRLKLEGGTCSTLACDPPRRSLLYRPRREKHSDSVLGFR
jgi:hypothetical protein